MVDVILRLLSLAAFAASLAVLGFYVPSLDMIIVIGVVIVMAAYDFLLRPILMRRKRRPT